MSSCWATSGHITYTSSRVALTVTPDGWICGHSTREMEGAIVVRQHVDNTATPSANLGKHELRLQCLPISAYMSYSLPGTKSSCPKLTCKARISQLFDSASRAAFRSRMRQIIQTSFATAVIACTACPGWQVTLHTVDVRGSRLVCLQGHLSECFYVQSSGACRQRSSAHSLPSIQTMNRSMQNFCIDLLMVWMDGKTRNPR